MPPSSLDAELEGLREEQSLWRLDAEERGRGWGERHLASPLIPPVPASGGQGSLVNVLNSLEELVHWDLEQRRAEGGSLSQWTSDRHGPGGHMSWCSQFIPAILEPFYLFFGCATWLMGS